MKDRETVIVSQGAVFEAPELTRVINQDSEQQDTEPFNHMPPRVTDEMFPDTLKEAVIACCHQSEAVRVAVAVNIIARFSALIGPTVYYQLGDERRLLNNYYLLVGPSGMGKGASEHGPARIFRRVEDHLEVRFMEAMDAGKADGLKVYPPLDIHEGGLSSGEGLAAAKDDGSPSNPASPVISDKRFYIQEPEFGNVLNMAQRQGNTLSHVLRNGYDGKKIRPLTKRDKVCVTDPYFVLVGNITPAELVQHDLASSMSVNGMLNRMLMIWTQLEQRQPIPKAMSQQAVDSIASDFADAVLYARHRSFETHWKKQAGIARSITLETNAETLWISEYYNLVNTPDCGLVSTLCRRHRLHTLILASLFALMARRDTIRADDLKAALAWIAYSRQSIIYSYRSFSAQQNAEETHRLSLDLLHHIDLNQENRGSCSCSDIYKSFGNKLTKDKLHAALERLLSHIPPLIDCEKIIRGRGRPVQKIALTKEGLTILYSNRKGG